MMTMLKMDKGLILVVLGLLICGCSDAWAQAQQGCSTSKCHAEMGKAEWVHGPVGVGACTVCHSQVGDADHEFAFPAENEELCFACHEDSRDLMMQDNIHTPVAEGECTGCHDPHQSAYRFQLKGEVRSLCLNCHGEDMFMGETVHGPVAAGECTACHDPHASANPYQLMAPEDQLCFTCHDDRRDMMNKRHVHDPVADSCTNCHEVHASQAAHLLPQNPPGLCFDCHNELAQTVSVSHPHPPVASGDCFQCHDPHASDFPKLFAMPQEELCFSCHDDLKEYVDSQEHHHGPVAQGDCSACHDPHGSENHKILRQFFPEDFYTPYKEEKYAICFECHNHQIAMEAETKTLTDFRDGERNLHFLHVNKDDKGRSCKACHQVHASNQEKHIRVSVPYGSISWELPVTFTKTENGGSCNVGCHAPKRYSRK